MNIIQIYFTGVIVATIITVIILATKPKVFITDLIESIVNIAGSWILVLSCLAKIIKTLLQVRGKNIIVWQKNEKKNDKKIIGKWKAIDFVFDTADFTPGQKYWKGDLYLKTLTLLPKGQTPMSPAITWTKGKILDHNDKTASAYEIKKIDGKEYMFFEWKSGDYTFRGQKPAYYVLEKVKK